MIDNHDLADEAVMLTGFQSDITATLLDHRGDVDWAHSAVERCIGTWRADGTASAAFQLARAAMTAYCILWDPDRTGETSAD